MKKEEKEIAVNVSSGAEKVEKIEKKTSAGGGSKRKSVVKTEQTTESAKGEAALGAAKKEAVSEKARQETKAAKARVDKALAKKKKAAKKKAAREKRRAEKKAKIEKHAAERKAIAEKRALERKARIEKKKAEHEEKIRRRAHRKANRNQAAAKKRASKKKERKEREKGYGGWIAAVVSLGVVSLALATTVTVGAMDLKATKDGAMTGHKATVYELTGIMENVDDDLDRVRISTTPAQQSRILTDLLVQTRLAELDLEKLPISLEQDRNVTEFINRTAMECERMLGKLRNGETLSDGDFQTLDGLYKTNHAIREEVNGMLEKMTDKDLKDYIKDGVGSIADTMQNLEKLTLEENRAALERFKESFKMPSPDVEKDAKRIDPTKAQELCKGYFSDYSVGEYTCVGETVTKGYSAYNFQGYDEKGIMFFAELDQKDGSLLRFDYYEDCMQETFDRPNAERIADEFLEKLGYDDMEVVRVMDNGSTSDFTYVYENDGVLYYPDEIHVKVCRSRGTVSGFDCTKYKKNHRGRDAMNAKITMGEASEKLHDGMTLESSSLCVVQTARGEHLAYEFLCGYEEQNYFVYIDAQDGREIAIFNTKNLHR